MSKYVPGTPGEQQEMLAGLGFKGWDDIYRDVPAEVKLEEGALPLEEGMGEMKAAARMEELASENKVYKSIFRGAGAYDHFIPPIVTRVTSNERFLTAYTPYQAEISQGILQSIFEYQTMICELTGMDVSNASVYDGATASAESAMMCLDRKHSGVLVSECVNPAYREVVETYCRARNVSFGVIPGKDGVTDTDAMAEMIKDDTACVMLQYPNFYGIIEDIEACGNIIHEKGAKFIVNCNPIALGILKTPAEAGADVACGEGQPLGLPLSYGGPYLGFMAATKAMMRKLPGRIVGETTDHDGNRAYVLTLQAREQHIKREKAGSNICSNEALCAMTAAVYLSAVGPEGLKDVALTSASNAAYLKTVLEEAGLKAAYDKPFFHEFVTVLPCEGGSGTEETEKCGIEAAEEKADAILAALDKEGILGGLPLGGGKILWCATEKCGKDSMDKAASVVKEVLS